MGGDDRTLDFYTSEAAGYADYSSSEAGTRLIERFAAMLPAGGDVLDFGCGAGWAADRFRQLGFRASGFDGSAGLAAEARRRYGIEVTLGRFDAFGAIGAHDGIWASFCLLHDSREAMPGHLARLHRALRPGGAIYLGLKEGEGCRRDRLDRLYTYFTEPEMRGLMESAGFTGLAAEIEPSTGFDGAPASAMHIFARRP